MASIQLSNATVDIIDHLTWGQREIIQAAMLSGSKVSARAQDIDIDAQALLAAKYKALEIAVVKITDADGKERPYSREWMDGLSVEDGETLFNAVNAVTSPEKK